MKATLTRKAEGWYNLYQDKIGIGSTHSELQGYKLSKQNCDEIFGVVDVEKLFNEVDETIDFHEFCFSSFKLGFNKAMELNKDKQFTVEDIKRAFIAGSNFTSPDEVVLNKTFGESMSSLIKSLQQPTEIEVEIEMEVVPDFYPRSDEDGSIFTSNKKEQPKLDENRCLILKKAPLTERFK